MTIGRWHSEIDKAEQRKSFSPRLFCLFPLLRRRCCSFVFLRPFPNAPLAVDQDAFDWICSSKNKGGIVCVDSVAVTELAFPFSSDCPLSEW